MTRAQFYKRYYGSEKIRALIKKQFDGASFAVGSGPHLMEMKWSFPVKLTTVDRIDELLDEGLDIYRPALSTGESFYIFWDLEYYNRKRKDYVYRHQRKVFARMEPVMVEIIKSLKSYGIEYILDTTASGFHFWTKISKKSSVFGLLASEGFLTESIKKKYAQIVYDDPKRRRAVDLKEAAAYDCAGKLLEYLTQKIRKKISGKKGIISFTVSDAPPRGKTDGFSSDITQYAHPLYMRVFRTIASLHQKNIMFYGGITPAVDIVRKNGVGFQEVLDCMWDAEKAAGFLENYDFNLRFSDDGWEELFNEYKMSEIRRGHREFERTPPENIDIGALPERIKGYFEEERVNPSLLAPVILQEVINYFTEKGESGKLKGVLALIAQFYNNPSYGWYDSAKFTGIDWKKYDAAQTANFWGRVYSAQFLTDKIKNDR